HVKEKSTVSGHRWLRDVGKLCTGLHNRLEFWRPRSKYARSSRSPFAVFWRLLPVGNLPQQLVLVAASSSSRQEVELGSDGASTSLDKAMLEE
ncbi:unnamed protein product, partial [Ectocarpus sp. 12 AP-2014]